MASHASHIRLVTKPTYQINRSAKNYFGTCKKRKQDSKIGLLVREGKAFALVPAARV